MAREYFCAYHSFLEWMSDLTDAEKGRLFDAALRYSAYGEIPTFGGKESALFPALKWSIDRDSKAYEEKCRKNRANINERYKTQADAGECVQSNTTVYDRIRTDTKTTKAKTKTKTKAKENNPPHPLVPDSLSPAKASAPTAEETGFGPELQSAFEDWLRYKSERRESYKLTGLRNLVSQLRNKASQYGDIAVADLIRQCMASNWKGIIYDKLGKEHSAHSRESPGQRDWAELADEMAAGMGDGLS